MRAAAFALASLPPACPPFTPPLAQAPADPVDGFHTKYSKFVRLGGGKLVLFWAVDEAADSISFAVRGTVQSNWLSIGIGHPTRCYTLITHTLSTHTQHTHSAHTHTHTHH